jgi:hypothetical protein
MTAKVLVADGSKPREGGADRAVVDVAVGVLIRADGQFLLTSRPPGFAWQGLPVQVQPVLPGTVPVLGWFAQERGFSGPTHG